MRPVSCASACHVQAGTPGGLDAGPVTCCMPRPPGGEFNAFAHCVEGEGGLLVLETAAQG